jgi:LPS sulfotransferase NodH
MGSATPFVILTAPRTGSSWLVDLLNNHPQVAAHGELFVPEAREFENAYGSHDLPYFDTYARNGGRPRSKLGLLRKRVAYLNELNGRSEVDCVGFKVSYKQATLSPGVLTYLSLRRARVVT